MRKSFSISTSKRLMKNCSRYLLLPVVTSRLLLHPEQKNAGCFSQVRLTWGNGASWCANYFASLRRADGRMVVTRSSQSSQSHPYSAYSVESSARPCAR